jgi:hypothetical protein
MGDWLRFAPARSRATIKFLCLFFLSPALFLGCGEPPEKSRRDPVEPRFSPVPYEVAATRVNTSRNFTQLIVVDPKYRKQENFPELVATLENMGRQSGIVMVMVYDDMKAAKLFDMAFDEALKEKTTKKGRFHDDHRIGSYWRNVHTGYHEYQAHPAGLNGPWLHLALPRPE